MRHCSSSRKRCFLALLGAALWLAAPALSCGQPEEDLRPPQMTMERTSSRPLLVGTPNTWDAGGPEYPVVFAEEGTYYLYYSATAGEGQPYQVGMATARSPLGPWTKQGDRPMMVPGPKDEYDDQGIIAGHVIRAQDMLFLYYSAQGRYAGERGWRLGVSLATSPGGRFTKSAHGPILDWGRPGEFDSGGQDSPTAVEVGGRMFLWFRGWTARPGGRQTAALGFATTTDITGAYGKEVPTPVLSPGSAGTWDKAYLGRPTVAQYDGLYHMWYGGYADQEGRYGRIGYAVSADGQSWEKAAKPVLQPGPPGSWDRDSVVQPFALIEGDTVYVYYTGIRYEDGRPVKGIGVATVPVDELGSRRR